MGLRAFPSLKDVPEPIDLVVVTVPLAAVPELIRDCASVGTHNMVVISAGGKELGGEGGDLEATIRRLARDNGVRIVGCNCIGVLDSESHFDTFFYAPERMARPAKGSIALITQSGTVGAVFLERLSGAGVSKFVSYGNRIDVDEGDLLAYLADDPATKVIACYIEGLEDGRKFLSVASEVSKKKPVVAFKAARSGQAAMASMSHTGFLGGSHRVVEGAFTQAGIISVDSVDELVAAAKSIAMQPCSSGPRVGLISNGAGAFVQAIDLLDSYGLEMPTLSEETTLGLRAVYPPYYLVQNPIDVTGSATSEDYEKGIERVATRSRRRHRDAVVRVPELSPGRRDRRGDGTVEHGRQADRLWRDGCALHQEDVRCDRGRRGTRLPFHPRLGGSCLRSVPGNSLRYHLATGRTYHRCSRSFGSWLGIISQPATRA